MCCCIMQLYTTTVSHLSSDGATKLADERELVLLGVALHDGTSGPHLCHDAAASPEVNGGSVVSLPFPRIKKKSKAFFRTVLVLKDTLWSPCALSGSVFSFLVHMGGKIPLIP